MPILKIHIDKLDFNVECRKGEESLLKEAEETINGKLKEFPEMQNLTQTKKIVMISLILAGELNVLKKKDNNSLISYEKINQELDVLEKLIDKKSK